MWKADHLSSSAALSRFRVISKLKIEHVPHNSRLGRDHIWFVLELLHIPSAWKLPPEMPLSASKIHLKRDKWDSRYMEFFAKKRLFRQDNVDLSEIFHDIICTEIAEVSCRSFRNSKYWIIRTTNAQKCRIWSKKCENQDFSSHYINFRIFPVWRTIAMLMLESSPNLSSQLLLVFENEQKDGFRVWTSDHLTQQQIFKNSYLND